MFKTSRRQTAAFLVFADESQPDEILLEHLHGLARKAQVCSDYVETHRTLMLFEKSEVSLLDRIEAQTIDALHVEHLGDMFWGDDLVGLC